MARAVAFSKSIYIYDTVAFICTESRKTGRCCPNLSFRRKICLRFHRDDDNHCHVISRDGDSTLNNCADIGCRLCRKVVTTVCLLF